MNFACWNIQGISTKYSEVLRTIDQYQLDIVVLSETKKKGNGNEVNQNYLHFYSGVDKDKRARAGVSIMINKKWQKYIRNSEAINERLIKIEVDILAHRIVIIGVYAPTDDASVAEKEEFLEKLTLLLNTVGNNKEVILMGDFNGRVGSSLSDNIIGRHGEEVINDNGLRLKEVCDQYRLKILNGFFQHKNIHKYTWIQTTKGLKSIIDYIIVKQASSIKWYDVRVQRGAVCGSDHFLLKGSVCIKYKKRGNTQNNQQRALLFPKYSIEKLCDESNTFLYKLLLANKMANTPIGNANDHYQHLKTSIHETAKETLGYKIPNNKHYSDEPWWTEELENLVDEKKQLYLKWLASKDPEDRKNYARLKYEVKKQVKQAKNSLWEDKCDEIDRSLGGSKAKQAWKILRTLKKNNKESRIIDPIGIDKWKQYYQELLTEKRNQFMDIDYEVQITNTREPDISETEVLEALGCMKNGKAAGPGGIPIELIKHAPLIVIKEIALIFNKCLKGDEIPDEWKQAHISSIHKKGCKLICDNYRGISVTASIGRLYGRILKNRIEQSVEISEEQSGFRSGRSCVDNIFCLKQLAEKTIARSRELHLIFIDLKKAYDTVPVNQLWKAIENATIPTEYQNALKKLYNDTKSQIKIGGELSDEFPVNKGLRQGCCISPTLFKIYIDKALSEWRRKCSQMGVKMEDGTIYSLLFADDQVILAEDEEDVSYMFRKLVEEYEKWGLEINLQKTEYMVIGAQGHDLHTEKGVIKNTNHYKYLGVTLTSDGRDELDVQNKIRRGKTIIKQLHPILWNDTISKNTKKRIFNSFVESTTTYGSEVWTLNKSLKDKIAATEMMYWRRCCKVTLMDRIRNDDIRERMNIDKPLTTIIEEKQLTWYGHMRRMNENRMPKKVWEWTPTQRRKRGRPRRHWNMEVLEAAEKRGLNIDMYTDRKEWRLGCGRRPRL